MNENPSSVMCSMFSSEPVSRLSTQITLWRWASRKSQRWEPRNPAPPVTTEVGIRGIVLTRAGRSRRIEKRSHFERHRVPSYRRHDHRYFASLLPPFPPQAVLDRRRPAPRRPDGRSDLGLLADAG